MNKYTFHKIEETHVDVVVKIYNSNKTFLQKHMGISGVTKDFIVKEIEEMRNHGFDSLIIKNNRGEIVGVCDFKIEDEVYLSLLMIDAKLKGNGIGGRVYNQLEKIFKSKKASSVRIDVVYDYEENVLRFWEKQGFVANEKINLYWNGYKLNAIKMCKSI